MFTSLSPNKALLRVAPTCSFPQTCFWTHDWQHKALKTQLRVWFTSLVSSMYLLVPTTHDRFQHPKSIWELTFPFQLLPVASPFPPNVIIPGVSARFSTLTWTALPLPFCSNGFISMVFWNLTAWTLGFTPAYADSFLCLQLCSLLLCPVYLLDTG